MKKRFLAAITVALILAAFSATASAQTREFCFQWHGYAAHQAEGGAATKKDNTNMYYVTVTDGNLNKIWVRCRTGDGKQFAGNSFLGKAGVSRYYETYISGKNIGGRKYTLWAQASESRTNEAVWAGGRWTP